MKGNRGHVLALPYPTQGHINPLFQFSKRLSSKGLNITFAITRYIFHSTHPNSSSDSIQIDTISDGYDQGGFAQAESIKDYLTSLEAVGAKTLMELIIKHQSSSNPIDCIIYDSFLTWALDVAKKFGIAGAAFFTQPCAVNYIYYCVHHGLLTLPVTTLPVSIPGLPLLELRDMPSFIYVSGSYPAYFEMMLNQFSNTNKADFILVNTFYKLENEVVDSMSKVSPLLTIGPTIPSIYLDKRLDDDKNYGFNLFTLDSSNYVNWLNTKPSGSVIYVSFGSLSELSEEQMEELAWGLKGSNHYFLWAVRATEEAKVPKELIEETSNKGMLVKWSTQIEILSNEGVGCFFTHCGWNSTIEALSFGVPMVGMPQWTDQTTNAKFVEDVWKVGVRVKSDENGIVKRDEIESCIRQVMEGERGREIKENAKKWKELAKEAMSEGGTSHNNIDEFISNLINLR